MIGKLSGLEFLDDRPVMEVERNMAEAWASGGVTAERKAKEEFHEGKRAYEERNMALWAEMRRKAKEEYQQQQAEKERRLKMANTEEEKEAYTEETPSLVNIVNLCGKAGSVYCIHFTLALSLSLMHMIN